MNKSCSTEYTCHRHIERDFVKNITARDDQLCSMDISDGVTCGLITYLNRSFIDFRICCEGTDYCNTNDTAVDKFIRKHVLGMCVYMSYCVFVFVIQ